jgi:phenylpropionate dioxygenase-like ring-hydroxylating dioxygenase large terminal subunit
MTYVRNAWYVSAWALDVAPECLLGVRLLNEPIVIWRNTAGNLVALEDRCVHRLAPLSLGYCEGERLRCRYHGLLYDRTGRVVEIPGQHRVPSSLRARAYPVVERHNWVWIWMGDAAAANEALIPPIMGMNDPDYLCAHGQLDYAAEARFINENLLDLSHVSYLHTESFRMSETWAREAPTVTEHDRSIRSERWIRSEGPLGTVDADKQVDTYFCYDFFVPGVLLMSVRTYPVGTADALNGRPPDLSAAAETFTSQAITPLTDKTARYFYIMGRRRRGEETVYDMAITEKAYAEDKTMVEAQQRNIDATPGWRFIATTADRGVILFNRLVEKMSREGSTSLGKKPSPDTRST